MKKSELKELIKECIVELNEFGFNRKKDKGSSSSSIVSPTDSVFDDFMMKLKKSSDYKHGTKVASIGFDKKNNIMFFEGVDGEDYQMDMKTGKVSKKEFAPGVYKKIKSFD